MNKLCSSFLLGVVLIAPIASWSACNIINGMAYGDCQNVQVHRGTRPALHVRSQVTESAVIAGATVYSGGSLDLTGIANGDVLVNRGGRLSVTGMVSATVRNNGGFVEIEGTIDRLISNGGNTVVSGQVGSFAGRGPVIFKKGSVLQGMPLVRRLRLPTTSPSGSGD